MDAQHPSHRLEPPADPAWLTPRQVGDLLQLSRAGRYRLADDATFPCTRLGRTWRIEEAALRRWLASRTQGKRARA